MVNALKKSGVDFGEPSMATMLSDIQEIHDNINIELWKEYCIDLAKLVLNPEEVTIFEKEIKDL